jgi:metallo-beta-lactamase family protein
MEDSLNELTYAVNDTLKRKGGNVIIPAFTVGRTQDILYMLGLLTQQGRMSGLHIYVDSPMATSATEITLKHMELLDADARRLMDWQREGNNFPKISFIEDVAESRALNEIRHGAVIISASGMCDAGRIKHHLRYNLGRKECSVIITGFQAGGTLGRRIVDGAKSVHIFKEDVPVRADIYTIGGLSAHADQKALMGWLGKFHKPPRQTFVVHGEASTADQFAELVGRELGWKVKVPELGEVVEL